MSVLDPPIQDEVALAYIANKSIIPLGREFHRKVNANTPSGMSVYELDILEYDRYRYSTCECK